MPPDIVNVAVVFPALQVMSTSHIVSEVGETLGALVHCIVIVADVEAPVESYTVRVTVPAGAFIGIVTVIVELEPVHTPPSLPSLTPFPAVPPPAPLSLNALVRSSDVVV